MPEQFALFADLPPGCRVRQCRLRPCTKEFLDQKVVQLAFDLSQPVDPDADPFFDSPVVHRILSAKKAPALSISAPCSVFDLATSPVTINLQTPSRPAITRIDRTDGLVRCVRIVMQDTDDWKKKEAARRAKQVVPKPPKSAKTFSKKFQALIGKQS